MKSARPAKLAPYLFLTAVMLAPEAWAYLDPSTGSMILSAIVGLFATAALAIKTFWYRIKNLVRRREPERPVRRESTPPQDKPGSAESGPASD
jgi:hypothetical protein